MFISGVDLIPEMWISFIRTRGSCLSGLLDHLGRSIHRAFFNILAQNRHSTISVHYRDQFIRTGFYAEAAAGTKSRIDTRQGVFNADCAAGAKLQAVTVTEAAERAAAPGTARVSACAAIRLRHDRCKRFRHSE